MKNSILTVFTGVLGSIAIDSSTAVINSIPTLETVNESVGIVSQILVLVATLVALFKRKKRNENE